MKEEIKLKNRKIRLEQESLRLREEQKKFNQRRLIEFGSIINRLELDIDTEVFLGAMLYIKRLIEDDSSIKDKWISDAKEYKNNLSVLKKQKRGIILRIDYDVDKMINYEDNDKNYEESLRGYGLKWNSFRREWYGYVSDYDALREYLDNLSIKYDINDV